MSFGNHTSTVPPVTKYLLITTIAVYVVQLLPGIGTLAMSWGALVPSLTFAHGQLWRLVSYMLLHDTHAPFHLLFNMLALWMFGGELEQRWGSRRYLGFYLITGAGAGLLNILNLFSPVNAFTHIIGASGALLGLMTAYAWYFPDRRILVFFVFPLPVRWAVALFGAVSLLFAIQGGGGAVAHLTHLGGIVVALVYLRYQSAVEHALEILAHKRHEQQQKAERQQTQSRQDYFENTIDPLLKKISQEGMESLTAQERKVLFEAGRKDQSSFAGSRILPVDFTRRTKKR